MNGTEKPKLPVGLGTALAEKTGALKYFSELSAEKQREVIEHTNTISSRTELRNFVRSMAGFGSII